jgi:hypothetical protein
MSISYAEKIEQEIKQMPAEYLPALFNIVHIFRESVSEKNTADSFRQGFKETLSDQVHSVETLWDDLENESLSNNDHQFLKSAIADGLKGQVKDAEEVFSRLESKYQALENGFSL